MNKTSFTYFFIIFFSSCSVQLASIPDKSAEQIAANYKVLKNISYGSDKEQDLDIYISKDAKKLSDKISLLFSYMAVAITSVTNQGGKIHSTLLR
jgi:hypothetical protein